MFRKFAKLGTVKQRVTRGEPTHARRTSNGFPSTADRWYGFSESLDFKLCLNQLLEG